MRKPEVHDSPISNFLDDRLPSPPSKSQTRQRMPRFGEFPSNSQDGFGNTTVRSATHSQLLDSHLRESPSNRFSTWRPSEELAGYQ